MNPNVVTTDRPLSTLPDRAAHLASVPYPHHHYEEPIHHIPSDDPYYLHLQENLSIMKKDEGTDPVNFSASPHVPSKPLPAATSEGFIVKDDRHVERSTSPINDNLINKILTEERCRDEDQFTFSIGKGSHRLNDPLRDRVLHGRDVKMKTASASHYRDLIRERLRVLMNRSRIKRDFYEDEHADEEEGESFERRPVAQNRYSRRRNEGLDETQAYTKEMMSSMATIMSAVGDILTTGGKQHYWKNSSVKRSKSLPPSTVSSVLPDRLETAIGSIPQSSSVSTLKAHGDNLKELSQLITKKEEMPKSKSAVIDMIFAKLQAIESHEAEMCSFLEKTTKPKLPEGSEKNSASPSSFGTSSKSLSANNVKQHVRKQNEMHKPVTLYQYFPSLRDVSCEEQDNIYDYMKELQQ
jgi:hypothetical protein